MKSIWNVVRSAAVPAGARMLVMLPLLAAFALGQSSSTPGVHLLMRFPTLHGNTVVFEAGGNLWQVARTGGEAERLTSDPGYDMMPRFSPDGRWIAFTGQYDGNTDVYVIPASGGPARRLTFHSDITEHPPTRWGPDNMVVTWTPDSRNIVFLSRRTTFNGWFGQLFEVPVTGGLPTQLPLPKGGILSYSPGGHRIAYNRIFRDFRTWRRYKGGLAQNVWIYNFSTHATTQVTDWPGTERDPMWYHNRIYFISDHGPDQILNLWSYDLGSHRFRQLTHFKTYDIDFPSLGDTGITFQQGGALYVYDLPSQKLHKLEVTIPADGTRTRPRWVKTAKDIQSFDLAPNGQRAVFGARGDIYTVPRKHGATRDITRTSKAQEQYPAWSPNGKWIAYETDITGESEIAIRPSNGEGKEQILTHSTTGTDLAPEWSPESTKLAFSDSNYTLWIVDIATHELTRVDRDPRQELTDFSWSPHGGWLAYTKMDSAGLPQIYLYNLATAKATRVSQGMAADVDPVFGPGGNHLFFVSYRNDDPVPDDIAENVASLKMTGIYEVNLRANEPYQFAPRSDEGTGPAPGKKKDAKPDASGPIAIDLAGFMDRAVPLPIPSGDYTELAVHGGRVYYESMATANMNGTPLNGEQSSVHWFDLKTRKDHTLLGNVNSFVLSHDGNSVLLQRGGQYIIANARPEGPTPKLDPLMLDHMQAWINPVEEWDEMFNQAWRLNRDFFVNPKMNGVNWDQVHEEFARLLPQLGCREDLNYLIGEMIGSLDESHCYVWGGDDDDPIKPVPTGLLGIDFGLDQASGLYTIRKIYPGDETRPDRHSPLGEPGVAAKAGDFILAINGQPLKAPENPYRLLVGTLGQPVTLTLASSASGAGRHDVLVKPVPNEMLIRLHSWIDHNRDVVDRESGGKIGYIYLSDMETLGMEQFIRQYYPQLRKPGLIIDDRFNGGGFIDEMLLNRLRHIIIGMQATRQGAPQTIPEQVSHSIKVTLINHYSASDGDMFPWYFRKYGLGPLIGTRTWGGVRGYFAPFTLLDGGQLVVSEMAVYGRHSEWVIENHGVVPDIRVDDLPGDVMAGKDAQLNAAVHYILNKLKTNPMTIPPQPAPLPAYPAPGSGK